MKRRAVPFILLASISLLLANCVVIPPKQAQTPPPNLTLPELEAEGFIFKPLYCNTNGDEAVCSIILTNNGDEERLIWLDPRKSYLYDDLGNQHPVTIRIGEKEVPSTMCCMEQNFIPKVSVAVSFIAGKMPIDTKNVTLTIDWEDTKGINFGHTKLRSLAIKDIPVL